MMQELKVRDEDGELDVTYKCIIGIASGSNWIDHWMLVVDPNYYGILGIKGN